MASQSLVETLTTQVSNLQIQPTPKVDEVALIKQANDMDETNLRNVLKYLADKYHNTQSEVSDDTYDELVDIFESKFGEFAEVGAPPRGQKVELPFYLGSLKKIKKADELRIWTGKFEGPYVLQDKIDGLTLLFTSKMEGDKRVYRLYTRGGGTNGMDVSHVIEHLNLPKPTCDIAIRGEIVMSKAVFAKIGTEFKNARNMLSGIINAKDSFKPEFAKELTYVAFRVMDTQENPEQQVLRLMSLGFTIPYAVVSPNLSMELLEQIFLQRKEAATYEMDGLVVYQNKHIEYPTGEKPKHVVAFKMNTEMKETTVRGVVWEASKDRLLKPVIIYEPVMLSGATCQRVSGDNARYICTNGIGPGAKIIMTRSGDTIPRIVKVLSPVQPQIPDPKEHGVYDWNENQVEFVLKQDNAQVLAAKIEHFLNKLDVKNVGPARVETFVKGGLVSIYHVLAATPQHFEAMERIGPHLAQQIWTEIHTKIQNVPLAKLMAASCIFPNLGERRIQLIVEAHPNIMDYVTADKGQLIALIQSIKGFKKLAELFVANLPTFVQWLKQHPMITIKQTGSLLQMDPSRPQVPQNLVGMTFVFTGQRDKEMETQIQERGGKIGTAVSKNTAYLIMHDMSEVKGKAEKAMGLGVKVVSKDQFRQSFLH